MVKQLQPGKPHADYEAKYRTLPVSQKHVIGSALIAQFASDNAKFQPEFQTERFIHGKVRPFRLRASDKNFNQIVAAEFIDNTVEQHIKFGQVLAKNLSHNCGVNHLPKHLQAFVLAHLTHAAKIQLPVNKQLDRQLIVKGDNSPVVFGFKSSKPTFQALVQQYKKVTGLNSVSKSALRMLLAMHKKASGKKFGKLQNLLAGNSEQSNFAIIADGAGNNSVKGFSASSQSSSLNSSSISPTFAAKGFDQWIAKDAFKSTLSSASGNFSETFNNIPSHGLNGSSIMGVAIGSGSYHAAQKQSCSNSGSNVNKNICLANSCSGSSPSAMTAQSVRDKGTGFGTAPMRFLQSMPTGPPTSEFSS